MKETRLSNEPQKFINTKLDELRQIYVNITTSYEFFYVIEGTIYANCYEETHRLESGDMFMATPGQAFMLIPDSEPALYISMSIHPLGVKKQELYHQKILPCVFKKDQIRQAHLNLLYSIYQESLQAEHSQVQELIEVFLQKLPWKERQTGLETQSDKKMELILKASQILADVDPGLEELALKLNISPSYLSRVFKEVTGMRFSDFSQRKKLQKSSQLLLSGMSIEDIALTIGFTSSKSLNRIYRQFVKTTPSSYRKYLLELANNQKKEEDLRYKASFQKFVEHYAEPSYTNTMKEYLGEKYNYHHVSTSAPSIQDPTLGQRAVSLDNFGEDYLKEIQSLNSINSNGQLALNLDIPSEDNGAIFFKDLNKWGDEEDLFKILAKINEINIPAILSVGVKDQSIKEFCKNHKREEIGDYLKLVENFYKKIIKNVTRPIAETYYYVFDTSGVLEFESPKSIMYFFEFVEKHHLMLEQLLYTSNFNSVYHLGKQSSAELEDIVDFISKNRHRVRLPKYSYAQITLAQKLKLSNPHQLLSAIEQSKKVIKQLNAFEEDDRLKRTKIKLQGIDMDLVIDYVDPLYHDLFFAILTLDLWMKLKGKSRIIPNYNFSFACRTKESLFTSKLIDKSGFPTPFYHINLFVSQMPENVIYHKEGCLISKNEDEIHLLVYTNPLLDYSFAIEKGFEYLSDYKREVFIDISDLKGYYKETTQILNYENGSPYFQLRNFKQPELMSAYEKEYVRSHSTPLLMSDYKEVSGKLELTLTLKPFEVVYKVFTKIKDPR